mmetsp:Transcript_114989/g.330277  ORF Transcript_114989/g.330277 Transcript_114989/m.330277 type:complete len:280 (-) Transcript_114989:239-1078(-)
MSGVRHADLIDNAEAAPPRSSSRSGASRCSRARLCMRSKRFSASMIAVCVSLTSASNCRRISTVSARRFFMAAVVLALALSERSCTDARMLAVASQNCAATSSCSRSVSKNCHAWPLLSKWKVSLRCCISSRPLVKGSSASWPRSCWLCSWLRATRSTPTSASKASWKPSWICSEAGRPWRNSMRFSATFSTPCKVLRARCKEPAVCATSKILRSTASMQSCSASARAFSSARRFFNKSSAAVLPATVCGGRCHASSRTALVWLTSTKLPPGAAMSFWS